MGGVKGRTGTYVRTPEMLANYSRAAKKRNYTPEGRSKIAAKFHRMVAEGKHPCQGKHWKFSKEARAARLGKPGNHLGHKHTEEVKALLRLATIKGRLKQARRKAPSGIEKTVYSFLEDAGVVFGRQVHIGEGYILDALIPSLSLAIEVDGKYWHSTPRARATDARKDAFIKNLGMRILRIPEVSVHDGSFRQNINSALKESHA